MITNNHVVVNYQNNFYPDKLIIKIHTDLNSLKENREIEIPLYEENIDSIDRKIILVSPNIEGNFTILEGNKRAVALQSINRLTGNIAYLGISDWIKEYGWANYANLYRACDGI